MPPPSPPGTPRIDRRLRLVIPVDETARGTIYIHTQPLSLEVFEQYFEVISIAHGLLYQQGQSVLSGPRIAAMHIRKAADRLGQRAEVDQGLFPAIEQLTNVASLEEGKGWTMTPYYNAKAWLDDDDRSRVENAIAFFIINSAVMPPSQLPSLFGLMASLWGAQTTSSNSTDFAAGLKTSIAAGSTEAAA